jgi:ribose-phosphate pyrophosphokinase
VDAESIAAGTLIGDVAGKTVLLADDMCSTGGTLMLAASLCRDAGAKRIFAAVTHGLLIGECISRLEESPIERLFIGNTVPGTAFVEHPKVEVVSLASLFGEAVHRVLAAESVSSLFSPALV